jgi:hypothetical protein
MNGGTPPLAPLSSELRHCTAYPVLANGRDPLRPASPRLRSLLDRKPLGLNPWVREELS